VVAAGGSHRGWFYEYFPWLAAATLPWTVMMLAALYVAIWRSRRNLRVAVVLIWLAVVFVPLLVAGQKQKHYLFPAIPPLAILTGWFIDRALRAVALTRLRALEDKAMILTLAAFALAAPLVLPVAQWHRGQLIALDLVVACAALVAAGGLLIVFWRFHKSRAALWDATLAFSMTVAIATSMMCDVWAPSFDTVTPERMAARIQQRFGGRPLCFYHSAHPTLGFALRQVVPVAADAGELQTLLADEPDAIVLVEHDDHLAARASAPADAVAVPAGLIVRLDFRDADKTLLVCEASKRAGHG
jgi:hypothetical protein